MRSVRSLRLRHTTRWPTAPSSPEETVPSVRCASLSTCYPVRRDNLGTAAAALPLHPPHPAARSTLGGRSSPEPAKPTVASPPCQGLEAQWHCALHSVRSDAPKNCLRSPARRSTPHPSTSGTPSVYYVIATMSSRMSRVALRAPARSAAMGPRKQDDNCTTIEELCQATVPPTVAL